MYLPVVDTIDAMVPLSADLSPRRDRQVDTLPNSIPSCVVLCLDLSCLLVMS